MVYYHSDQPGILDGLGDGAPTLSSNVWPAVMDYWHYTGDSTYNDALVKSILFQRGPHDDFWPANNASLGFWNAQVGAWADTAMGAAEFKLPDPPKDQPQYIKLVDNVFNNFVGQWNTSDACGGGLRMSNDPDTNGYAWKDGKAPTIGIYLHDANDTQLRLPATSSALPPDWADIPAT